MGKASRTISQNLCVSKRLGKDKVAMVQGKHRETGKDSLTEDKRVTAVVAAEDRSP